MSSFPPVPADAGVRHLTLPTEAGRSRLPFQIAALCNAGPLTTGAQA